MKEYKGILENWTRHTVPPKAYETLRAILRAEGNDDIPKNVYYIGSVRGRMKKTSAVVFEGASSITTLNSIYGLGKKYESKNY